MKDDKTSRLQECAAMFGVPMTNREDIQSGDSLVPVMPRELRLLKHLEDLFDPSVFDPMKKQRLLASLLVFVKCERVVRDSSRWSNNPNCNPESSKYLCPPGVRLK